MSKYLDPIMHEKGENRFENLMCQVKEVFASDYNDNGKSTNVTYFTGVSTFTKYISEFHGISKMSNISSNHFFGFVNMMKDLGMADRTLKSYMSGIRDFYDMGKQVWDKCKLVIPDNQRLDIPDRVSGGVERAWSNDEINSAKEIAVIMNRPDVYHAINIAANFGLRLDGTCTLTIKQIDNAFKNGYLTVVEKGGKERKIPITNYSQGQALIEAKAWGESKETWRDSIFCKDKNIGKYKGSIQDWIYNNRYKFQDKDRIPHWDAGKTYKGSKKKITKKSNLTFHGMRHKWAYEKYHEFISRGYSEEDSLGIVSKLLGHEREEVTKIYLARA